MIPAYSDDWASVWAADALEGAKLLEPQSVHAIVTSPPYWGLRSYLPEEDPNKALELGTEKTPEEYVERLVEIFRALKHVLRDDGTFWLNLGDSYAARPSQGNPPDSPWSGFVGNSRCEEAAKAGMANKGVPEGLKPKDLIGVPWLAAFALRADGWYLRRDIIWNKTNPMPESVIDRPTCSHEYVFLLSKSPRYFFDQEAVREEGSATSHGGNAANNHKYAWHPNIGDEGITGLGRTVEQNGASGRNIRSVWTIATKPYPGSHYATFPPDLVYPCVKAGTSERGVCAACGAPWERVVEQTETKYSVPEDKNGYEPPGQLRHGKQKINPDNRHEHGYYCASRTVGWNPTCSCGAETVPATVLDPFVGSGTALWAARKLGRKSVGFDLDPRNVALIEERMGTQGVLF